MLYTFALTIPANTPEPATATALLPLTAGTITEMNVSFPAGHAGLTHLKLRRGLHQVWPANPEANFSTDNQAIVWAENYPLLAAPFQLEAYAWNLDDTYPHTITVHISIDPSGVEASLLDQVRQLLGMGGA